MTENPGQKTLRSPLRILVVEDSDFLRQLFFTAFHDEHMIEAVSCAKDGWQLYIDKSPDIVFMDILLPDGNGHDLAHRIKERNPSAYVVMATASDYADDKAEADFNRVDGFITKPYDKQKINDIIDRYWENQGSKIRK
jgi:DNA-binding NtrC family response regulator